MSHELSIREDGTVEAAFAGKVPWHGLGVQVQENMTVNEALDLANLRWAVAVEKLFYSIRVGEYTEVPDKRAVIRMDNGEYFGTVGTRFKPIQNEEQADFLNALVGEGNVVECVGALFGGRKVFWTVKCPEDLMIGGEDRINQYIILANGHDGTIGFTCFWSPIRVVCNNTLRAALSGRNSDYSVRFKHTTNIDNRLEIARETLGIANRYFLDLANHFESFLEYKISDEDFKDYTKNLFGDKEDTRNIIAANYQAERHPGTLWAAYNAVTQHADHQMKFRGKENREAKRFESVMYGAGYRLKQKAFDLCRKQVSV